MSWDRFKQYFLHLPHLGFALDVSRMGFYDEFIDEMAPRMQDALQAMWELEQGAISNPDEDRMVGHYWLRAPQKAPSAEIRSQIEETLERIKNFVRRVHFGEISAPDGPFTDLLVVGIGGSALGPQFVAQALGSPDRDKLKIHFFDNTDPDGIQRTLKQIGAALKTTLVIVISKSGGTPETRNGMLEAQAAFRANGLEFARQAVAVTGVGSKLDKVAESEGWRERFPMWDWVGGRTSETGPVGLLPAALQGIDIQEFLNGAAAMDEATRIDNVRRNPAALLALMWYHATNGRGEKDMVILPYKDRLELFSKYLQQLVMESLGKELDLDGEEVFQGIAVYGNKGSTDQHAYVQQLREGVPNFFATFIEVLRDQTEGEPVQVEDGVTSGDYLQGFLLGTRSALAENGRESITITINEVSPRSVGMLIALYERAVGLYASLVNINAYHQPGVEAGKKAAAVVLKTKADIQNLLKSNAGHAFTAERVAAELKIEDPEVAFKLLEHLAANPAKQIQRSSVEDPFSATYCYKG